MFPAFVAKDGSRVYQGWKVSPVQDSLKTFAARQFTG